MTATQKKTYKVSELTWSVSTGWGEHSNRQLNKRGYWDVVRFEKNGEFVGSREMIDSKYLIYNLEHGQKTITLSEY